MEYYNTKSTNRKLYKMKKKEKHTLKYDTNHFCAVIPANCRILNLCSDDQRELKPACPKFPRSYQEDAELTLLNYTRQAFVSTIATGRKKKKKAATENAAVGRPETDDLDELADADPLFLSGILDGRNSLPRCRSCDSISNDATCNLTPAPGSFGTTWAISAKSS